MVHILAALYFGLLLVAGLGMLAAIFAANAELIASALGLKGLSPIAPLPATPYRQRGSARIIRIETARPRRLELQSLALCAAA